MNRTPTYLVTIGVMQMEPDVCEARPSWLHAVAAAAEHLPCLTREQLVQLDSVGFVQLRQADHGVDYVQIGRVS